MKIFTCLAIVLLMFSIKPEYSKTYYEDGVLKSEGWIIDMKKEKYWYFYHKNGRLKSKGHFRKNIKTGYWYFYNSNNKLTMEGSFENGKKSDWWKIYKSDTIEEVKYKNSQKEGLSIYRISGKPVKAEFYVKGKRTHEWFSLKQFRKEYPSL